MIVRSQIRQDARLQGLSQRRVSSNAAGAVLDDDTEVNDVGGSDDELSDSRVKIDLRDLLLDEAD